MTLSAMIETAPGIEPTDDDQRNRNRVEATVTTDLGQARLFDGWVLRQQALGASLHGRQTERRRHADLRADED